MPSRRSVAAALGLGLAASALTFTPAVAAATIDQTIAEIQGTGAASPVAGSTDLYRTRGVVTAVYPTGGFDGFYMQTEGTGLGADETPGASDGIFVWHGSGGSFTYPEVGDFVEVVGSVTEGGGPALNLTQLVPGADGSVTTVTEAHDPVTELQTNFPTSTDEREAHEGELLDVGAQRFTVTNTFPTNRFAEIGLATGNSPLIQPTEVARPGTPAAAAVEADNARRAVTLDDGASVDYTGAAKNEPLPWLSKMNPIRVGAAADVRRPLILDYRNGTWKLQPTSRVTDDGDAVVRFDNTRTRAPEAVGGDLRIATFNVLNYFNTTGEQFVADGGACTYFVDRAGEEVTDNTCTPDGPRGAADAEDLKRQQDKIVAAINGLGADVVSLEEIENSVKLKGATDKADRDDAVKALVAALNAAQGSARWAYAPSPSATELPALAEQDVIRTAFIYNPAKVSRVGASRVLTGSAPFGNAREPLAQAFKAKGVPNTTFAVIVNHFKSKGCGGDSGDNVDAHDGQGCFNGDRTRQADALTSFANDFAASRGTKRVFLTGDFNSYTQEDPMRRLYDAGYEAVESATPDEWSYSFSGLSGSLDHVLASPAAMDMVSGADIWEINANESLAFEYSRHNYNVTDFYQPNAFRASDHNPEIVGLNLPAADPGLAELNLLGINDFHGRINTNTVKFAGTVEQLADEGGEDHTLLVGAGDLIGASEFASAIAEDQPTIDVMNALGLDASAVGNHEFDKGWADLRDRVIGPESSPNALWDYLGANVYAKGTTDPVLPEYAQFEVDGVTVGVVGAVTQETASLVSPAGISDIDFGNPTQAVNRVAGELSDGNPANGEADVIVASFHAGARQGVGSNYADEVAKGGEFADMATLDPAVDAIFNGHTHQVYAWDAPVPGDPTRTRPILQTGEYGSNVGQVKLTVDRATGEVRSYSVRNVARTTLSDSDLVASYPRVGDVKQIVDQALANAAKVGNVPVGKITGDITRAFVGGSYGPNGYTATRGSGTEDRSAESTMGGLVGNALRDGLPADMGTPDLGLVNPGGLRDDLIYAGNTASNPENTDGVVTYAEANAVLPFVNNVSLVDLTGAQLKQVLEEQWQRAAPGGPAPSRPYLQLGLSDNVEVTADASRPVDSRITSVLIDGEPLDPAATYTVSTFSFLAAGGDNFHTLKQGVVRDTGLVDRDLWISYLEETMKTDAEPIAPDFARQQVFETGKPDSVEAGQHVEFTLGPDLLSPVVPTSGEKLDLTSLGSPANTSVTMTAVGADGGTTDLGSIPVTNGTAAVAFDVPADQAEGDNVVLEAQPSGSTLTIPVTAAAVAESTTAATPTPARVQMRRGTSDIEVTVSSAGVPTGEVAVFDGATEVGRETLTAGRATVTVGPFDTVGARTLTVRYLGDTATAASETEVAVEVTRQNPTIRVDREPRRVVADQTRTLLILDVVAGEGVTPTGRVEVRRHGNVLKAGTLEAGSARLRLPVFTQAGEKTVRVAYLGDDSVRAETVEYTFTVRSN